MVTFDDLAGQEQTLNGEYPAGVIHWGYGRWLHAGPGGPLATKNITFKGDDGVKSATFSLLRPRVVVSLGAYNEATQPAPLTLRCPGQPDHQAVLAAKETATVAPPWPGRCDSVSLASTNGWGTHFDDLLLEALLPEAPPPFPTTTVAFDDLTGQERMLKGQYPAGLIDFGRDQWWLSGPEGAMRTKHLSMNGPAGVKSATLTFPTPRRFVGLEAHNLGAPTTVTLQCAGQPDVTAALDAGQFRMIGTGWPNPCTAVRVTSGNGWDTDFDNLVVEALP
jgi:hypothetical protein